MAGEFERWAIKRLEMLCIPEPSDVVRYLQLMEDPAEVEQYLISFLDMQNQKHFDFMNEFLKKLLLNHTGLDTKFYRKPDIESQNSDIKTKQKSDKVRVDEPNQLQSTSLTKKNKFMPLYSEDAKSKDVVMLPGRHQCLCQASKHKLVNNCLTCGRIVCEQEGSGPCAFCGNLVMNQQELEVRNRSSHKLEMLEKKLLSDKRAEVKLLEEKTISDGLRKALDHKNLMIEFDRTSEQRTKVLDDESDYFHTGSKWLSPQNREILDQRENELRKLRFQKLNTFTIDFFGRKIVGDDSIQSQIYNPDDPVVKKILESKPTPVLQTFNSENENYASISPVYVDASEAISKCGKPSSVKLPHTQGSDLQSLRLRLQDREMLELVDDGMCISMHQPWASLLVAGIKKHEGRSWYSAHRGKLWIAAAGKVATKEEIAKVEHQYRVLLCNGNLQFPLCYPTGCLLGCVSVADVMAQQEYRKVYPKGESDSAFVFICENFQEMVIKFPLKGQHKIYQLNSKIHKDAKKFLAFNK